MAKKVIDKNIEEEEFVDSRYLVGMLDKTVTMVRHFDSQANILLGISSAIFLFSINFFHQNETLNLSVLVLVFFSGASTIVGLYSVHPPKPMRHRGQKQSILYNKTILSFPNAKEYSKELLRIIKTPEEMVEQYSTEIFNLYKYFYRPKRKLYKISRNIFMAGVILSLAIFVLEVLDL